MSFADFNTRIAEMANAPDPAEKERIRKEIWETYGKNGTVFITDMASFSSTVRNKGVTYFLAMIHRSRGILKKVVRDFSGDIVKFETDNAFAFFEDPADAIQAALQIMRELKDDNDGRPEDEHVNLGIGIDYGRMLMVGEGDFFGDPVNTASKLGEDLADNREVFVTERALKKSGLEIEGLVHKTKMISDIEIRYAELPIPR